GAGQAAAAAPLPAPAAWLAEPPPLPAVTDGRLERGPGDLDEPLRLVVDVADRDRHRRVGVPALDDGAAVDGEDVALLEDDLVARDAVDDDVVRGRADHGRE